ncbi:MAG TPA: hypothetical protein VK046_13040 [Actinomycetaceae bacterium]|nr:hypothetical protein [Actinomycetaceae bacterium]
MTPPGALAVGPLREVAARDLAAIASTALQRNGFVLRLRTLALGEMTWYPGL